MYMYIYNLYIHTFINNAIYLRDRIRSESEEEGKIFIGKYSPGILARGWEPAPISNWGSNSPPRASDAASRLASPVGRFGLV